MNRIDRLLDQMRLSPASISYRDLCFVCTHFFGEPRQRKSSHCVYKTPWTGDPRVNIQNDRGMAKAYQGRQVLKAVERLGEVEDERC